MEGVSALLDRGAAESMLRWWKDAGVDVLVEDEPRNWLVPGKVAAPAAEADRVPTSTTVRPPVPSPAAAIAELPQTLPDLLAWMRDSDDVPEAGWGTARILPSGDPTSPLMILTDMPEPEDAQAGRLLAGEVGALFDNMLKAIGFSRETVWLAPIATVRRIGRVTPSEADGLVGIARHHLALVAPRRLLIMGDTPNRALLGQDWQAKRGCLQTINLGDVSVEAVGTFHPRLLHKSPAYKKEAWSDLQLLKKGL